jgi:hypothetical protein
MDETIRLRHSATNRFHLPTAAQASLLLWDASSPVAPSLNLSQVSDWVSEASKKLEKLGSLRQGWDSYGGLPLKPEARDFTVRAIGWLGEEDLPTPAVVLGSGGTVQLEWRYGGKELDVDLGEGEAVEFVTVDRGGKIDEGRKEGDYAALLKSLARWLLLG